MCNLHVKAGIASSVPHLGIWKKLVLMKNNFVLVASRLAGTRNISPLIKKLEVMPQLVPDYHNGVHLSVEDSLEHRQTSSMSDF